jgi:hypothetical protein
MENENIYLFLIENMRKGSFTETRNAFPKSAELSRETTWKPTPPQTSKNQTYQEMLSTFKRISADEKVLLNEKEALSRNKETLRLRIFDQIGFRKRRIENYKTEITELRQQCASLHTAMEKYYSK